MDSLLESRERVEPLSIYIDFDDVICETARELAKLAERMFGRLVDYEKIGAFNLRKSFVLGEEDYLALMRAAHEDEMLLSLEPTPGALERMKAWREAGHRLEIVTGRPYSTREASLLWLERNGLAGVEVVNVDKFNRELAPEDDSWDRSLTLAELAQRRYDLAIEDAPAALEHLATMDVARVVIFDRPWNQEMEAPAPHFKRVTSWGELGL